MWGREQGHGQGDGPTPQTQPSRASARALAEERRRRAHEQAPHKLAWSAGSPRPAPSASGWGRRCFRTTGPGRGGAQGPSSQPPRTQALVTSWFSQAAAPGSEALPPLTETTRMCWALPGWGGLRGGELPSVAVVATSNWLRGTKACHDRPGPSPQPPAAETRPQQRRVRVGVVPSPGGRPGGSRKGKSLCSGRTGNRAQSGSGTPGYIQAPGPGAEKVGSSSWGWSLGGGAAADLGQRQSQLPLCLCHGGSGGSL